MAEIYKRNYVLSLWRQALTNTVWANRNIKYRKSLRYIDRRERQWQNLWKSVTWRWNLCLIFDWHIKTELSWKSQIKRWRSYVTSPTGIASDENWEIVIRRKYTGDNNEDGCFYLYEYVSKTKCKKYCCRIFCIAIWWRLICIDMLL